MNRTISLGTFCPDPLWTPSLWHGDTPRLTRCLADTLLVYLPSLLLLLAAPLIPRVHTASRNSLLHRTRQLLLLLLQLSTFSELLLRLPWLWEFLARASWPWLETRYEKRSSHPATVVSSLARLLSHQLAFRLYNRSSPTSLPLFLYWLLASSCSLLRFLSLPSDISLPFAATELLFLLSLLLSSLLTEPDLARPLPSSQGHAPSPSCTASPASRLLFSWVQPLTWRGWKGSLTPRDMWALRPEDS